MRSESDASAKLLISYQQVINNGVVISETVTSYELPVTSERDFSSGYWLLVTVNFFTDN